ncbi:MAG: hypothetical protein M0C28_38170 [Candidatus Moduliflexus flocculans]|nr:hypothetical protein [Candidatus Moduliflexus flocculans]
MVTALGRLPVQRPDAQRTGPLARRHRLGHRLQLFPREPWRARPRRRPSSRSRPIRCPRASSASSSSTSTPSSSSRTAIP